MRKIIIVSLRNTLESSRMFHLSDKHSLIAKYAVAFE